MHPSRLQNKPSSSFKLEAKHTEVTAKQLHKRYRPIYRDGHLLDTAIVRRYFRPQVRKASFPLINSFSSRFNFKSIGRVRCRFCSLSLHGLFSSDSWLFLGQLFRLWSLLCILRYLWDKTLLWGFSDLLFFLLLALNKFCTSRHMYRYRTVVATHYAVVDKRICNAVLAFTVHQTTINDEVIESPTSVRLAQLLSSWPKRVLDSVGIKVSIGVNPCRTG